MVLSTHWKVVTRLAGVDRWSLEEGDFFCVLPKQDCQQVGEPKHFGLRAFPRWSWETFLPHLVSLLS